MELTVAWLVPVVCKGFLHMGAPCPYVTVDFDWKGK